MSWRALVVALDGGESLRSRVSLYRHPLAGRPVLWHVVAALSRVVPAPERVTVLHRADAPLAAGDDWPAVDFVGADDADEARSLRALITRGGPQLIVDGAAPLLTARTLERLLRAADAGTSTLSDVRSERLAVAVAGDGAVLATARLPGVPEGAVRVAPADERELLRVTDRHTLAEASVETRDRLVRLHQSEGVSFLLPATTWIDVDVRVGADTLIYPGVVLEGATTIGPECVIGPHSRVVDASIGRGVELRGWNYVTRTSVRNHATLEPYERRGVD